MMQFVPYWNSLAGLTLTPAQWRDTGVQTFVFDAGILLQRPGIECSVDLKTMTGCFGKIIIDAHLIAPTKSGEIVYRGTDGAKKNVSLEVFETWLKQLAPDEIIVHQHLHLSDSSKCLSMDEATMRYALSDEPANLALQGVILESGSQSLNILEPSYAQDYQVLVDQCSCQTCQHDYTRSYLHHLLQHTPLLAQRLLVQHNIWQACNYLVN